ncbi:MAG TPA: GtrA family protein [Vicinamibacterales bacterium]|nr:GtrA family protein [Vicinamibacterales bacterium]
MFNLVGLAGFLLQIGTIALLSRGLGWSSIVATAVGLELAALQNFIGHSRWTWGDAPPSGISGWLTRFGRYQAAKTASLVANLGITAALIYLGFPAELANTAAVLICALPNYLISEHFVFHST